MLTPNRRKDSIINIRVTKEKKEELKEKAAKLGMSISGYIDYLGSHQKVVELPYGKELMQEVYSLNNKLDEITNCPLIEIQALRNALSLAIMNISSKLAQMEEGK